MIYAEIIAVGDELLIGQTIDTNSAWLGENLGAIGIHVRFKTTVGDNHDDMMDAFRRAGERADLVLITGGLGPTRDDITREILCEFFGSHMVIHEPSLLRVTAFFTERGLPMLESNRLQASVPAAAEVIDNFRGTAPGMWFNHGNKVFISMPGVPYEMTGMMEDVILDRIRKHFKCPEIIHQTIITQGIGESFLADKIRDWENELRTSGLQLAYLPSPGSVKLRISAYGLVEGKGALEVAGFVEKLKSLIPDHIVGFGKDTLPELIGKLLLENGATLAVAESCTGGFIAHSLTSIPGSSEYFKGGMVSYVNEIKEKWLDVPPGMIEKHGVVSEAVAIAMAIGIRDSSGATWGLSTTGIAGPTGGTSENPVGSVWIGVAGPGMAKARHFQFGKSRERNIVMATNAALDLLRKEIMAR